MYSLHTRNEIGSHQSQTSTAIVGVIAIYLLRRYAGSNNQYNIIIKKTKNKNRTVETK